MSNGKPRKVRSDKGLVMATPRDLYRIAWIAEQYAYLSAQLSLLITQVQGADIAADNSADNEDVTRPKAPSSEALLRDVQNRVIGYPIVERWPSTGQRSVTIEETIEMTYRTRKVVMNRTHDPTITPTR